MSDETSSSGLPSANVEANAEQPFLPAPNRVPIWRRNALPPTPRQSDDPYEFPSNLTPTLKRVRSRSKMSSNTSNAMRKAAMFVSHMQRHSSATLPTLTTGSSRKKEQDLKEASNTECTEKRKVVDSIDAAVCDRNDEKHSSGTFSRLTLEERPHPTSLPPKKPRLSHMRMSSSDMRPARKPVMIEPDFQMPSSSTPLRTPKPMNHSRSSMSLRLTPNNNGCEQKKGDDCVVKTPTNLPNSAEPRKLFHSRSSMNLRLTPERDMRERRMAETDVNVGASRSTPLSKLRHCATMSDLRGTISTPNRRRRVSLTQTESKKPSVVLRKRSSSVALGEVMLQHSSDDQKVGNVPEQLLEEASRKSASPLISMDTDDSAIENKHLIEKNTQSSSSTQTSVDMLIVKNDEDLAGGVNGVELTAAKAFSVEQSCNHESTKSKVTKCEELAEAKSVGSEEKCASENSEAISINDRVESDSVTVEIELKITHENVLASNAYINAEPISTKRSAEVPEETIRRSQNVVDVAGAEQEIPKETAQKTVQYEPALSSKTEICSLSFSLRDKNAESIHTIVGHHVEESAFCVCSVEASSSTQSCRFETEDSTEQLSQCPSALKPSLSASSSPNTAKANKSVRFKNVNVYYFARTQGSSTVPKSGEVSLGMVDKHFTKRQFPLWFGRRPELTLTHDGEESLSEGEDPGNIFDPEGHERCTAYQLPTLEGKARIKMLKRSGVQVQKDDGMESLESIRKSRLLCGCQCENGICNPETCQCAAEGIVCQVDGVDEFGSSHPCSCTSANCRNPEGRIEFDVLNVKNHCRMTILRTKHAEQSGLYDSPQRIRFSSEGEPQSAAQMCVLPNKNAAVGDRVQQVQQEISNTMDDPPTRKFPVTPVYKRSKQKRGLRVELAVGADSVEVDKVKFPSLLKDSPEEA